MTTRKAIPISITGISEASASEWDSFWSSCDYATYFQSREWMTTWMGLERTEAKLEPRLVTFSDGKRAVVPLVTTRIHKGLVKAHRLSVAGTYGGWLSNDGLQPVHAVQLSTYLLELGSLEWITNPCDPLVLNCGAVPGPTDETQIVALRGGIDAIGGRAAEAHRRAIRKALRSDVTIRQAQSLQDWRDYYDVYQDSVRRWGDSATSNHPFRLFETFWGLRSNRIALWLALRDGKVVAGALCFYAKRHVAYWHGAALESHFMFRPVNLLMNEAIADACMRGLEWFDLGLSGGHEGVRAFKRSLGAEGAPCAVISKTTAWHRTVARAAKFEACLKERLAGLTVGAAKDNTFGRLPI